MQRNNQQNQDIWLKLKEELIAHLLSRVAPCDYGKHNKRAKNFGQLSYAAIMFQLPTVPKRDKQYCDTYCT